MKYLYFQKRRKGKICREVKYIDEFVRKKLKF